MGFHASVLRMSTSTVPWSRSEAVATVTTHLLIAHHMIYTLPGNGKAARASSGSIARSLTWRGHSTGEGPPFSEERHDPAGWKSILWIEPERDFLVSRYVVYFEQHNIVDADIDYVQK